jgi:hypothetical protein
VKALCFMRCPEAERPILASGSRDKQVHLWYLEKRSSSQEVNISSESDSTVSLSDSTGIQVSVSSPKARLEMPVQLTHHQHFVNALAFYPPLLSPLHPNGSACWPGDCAGVFRRPFLIDLSASSRRTAPVLWE